MKDEYPYQSDQSGSMSSLTDEQVAEVCCEHHLPRGCWYDRCCDACPGDEHATPSDPPQDEHQQRADHYQHLYEQASEGKCGYSGLTIGACKASLCDCFEFPWVPPAPHEHPDPAPASADRGDRLYPYELADFEPSTGHMHTCSYHSLGTCDRECAGHLYCIAQDAEEALATRTGQAGTGDE